MIIYIYSRWGDQIGTLTDITSAKHTDELNGEDSLAVTFIGDQLIKGNRLVWEDKFGKWHEHIVSDLTVSHRDGRIESSAYCENSLAELATEFIVDRDMGGFLTVDNLLRQAIRDTRWEVGNVDVTLTWDIGSWHHISAYEAIQDIIKLQETIAAFPEVDLSTTIEVNSGRITARKINIELHRGSTSEQRFEYGHNLSGIDRTVDTGDIYTALYGYGATDPDYKKENDWEPEVKINFAEINDGKEWVGDEDARLIWGLPDGKGGVRHSFGVVEFSDCEDPDELLALTKSALNEVNVPIVRYTGTVANLAQAGFANGQDSQTGDDVYIIDSFLNDTLSGRVLKTTRDLLDEQGTEITLGNLAKTLTSSVGDKLATVDSLKERAATWDGVAQSNPQWLNSLVDSLNTFMNAVSGFVYMEQGEGILVLDKDRNENPTMAIQISGGCFRIANSKKSNGDWNWRTFGTGDGFTADVINAGVLRGGNTYFDLSNGSMYIENGQIIIDSPASGTIIRITPDEGFAISDRYTNESLVLIEPYGARFGRANNWNLKTSADGISFCKGSKILGSIDLSNWDNFNLEDDFTIRSEENVVIGTGTVDSPLRWMSVDKEQGFLFNGYSTPIGIWHFRGDNSVVSANSDMKNIRLTEFYSQNPSDKGVKASNGIVQIDHYGNFLVWGSVYFDPKEQDIEIKSKDSTGKEVITKYDRFTQCCVHIFQVIDGNETELVRADAALNRAGCINIGPVLINGFSDDLQISMKVRAFGEGANAGLKTGNEHSMYQTCLYVAEV